MSSGGREEQLATAARQLGHWAEGRAEGRGQRALRGGLRPASIVLLGSAREHLRPGGGVLCWLLHALCRATPRSRARYSSHTTRPAPHAGGCGARCALGPTREGKTNALAHTLRACFARAAARGRLAAGTMVLHCARSAGQAKRDETRRHRGTRPLVRTRADSSVNGRGGQSGERCGAVRCSAVRDSTVQQYSTRRHGAALAGQLTAAGVAACSQLHLRRRVVCSRRPGVVYSWQGSAVPAVSRSQRPRLRAHAC